MPRQRVGCEGIGVLGIVERCGRYVAPFCLDALKLPFVLTARGFAKAVEIARIIEADVSLIRLRHDVAN
jgi:hypothetical protein